MKHLRTFVMAVLLIAAVVVGACTQAATPAPATATAPAAQRATEAPAAAQPSEPTKPAESAPAAQGQTDRSNIRIVVVTHGQASDPFWSVVKNGVDQAAKDMGVKVEYQAPDKFDMVAMSQLIDAAVASKPNGLVVSIPDADALGPSIQNAVKGGIPVISINSGSDVAKKLGVLVHIGQTEYEAGYGGGERMAAAGAKKALCVNQEVGNAALDLRCKGFTDAMGKAGATVEVLAVDLANPTEAQQRVSAALQSKPDVDSILTLGPTGALPTLKALQDSDQIGKIKLATFDLSPEVLQAIEKGDMLFAIDQQQYLQGYLPIVLLTLYNTNLNTVANDVIMTGPGFVTEENAARVIELTRQGTR
ncbi:MAG: sugar ABC transporter substrate-binding protein [Ardenticatenaceae bacterium]|nr:sugar ABC transporter substrate-binding protein [Ardenticatenaceae bacterium]